MFFKDLARTEGHHASGGNPDFLTGPWIATFARPFASNNKISKAGDLKRSSFWKTPFIVSKTHLKKSATSFFQTPTFSLILGRRSSFLLPSPLHSPGQN